MTDDDDDDISTIGDDRKKQIVQEFDAQLAQHQTTEKASEYLGIKYNLSQAQVMGIVREHRQLDKDPDPDGGRAA